MCRHVNILNAAAICLSCCCMHTPLLQLSDEYSAATNDAIIAKEKRIKELEVVPHTYAWGMVFRVLCLHFAYDILVGDRDAAHVSVMVLMCLTGRTNGPAKE